MDTLESTFFYAQSLLLKSKTHVPVFLLSACILLFSVAWQLWRSSKRKQHLRLPPGRFGLPFIGETLQFLGTQRHNAPWEFIDDRVAMYGEIFKTHLIGDPTVVAANPAGNKLVFTNENKLVNVSWPGNVISVLGKRSLIALQGDKAKRIRHAMMTFLRPEALQMYTGKADKSVRSFLKEHFEGKSEVNLYPLMKKFTFSIACELLMSRHEKKEQEMLEDPFTVLMKGILQLPINLPGTRFYKAMAAASFICSRFQPWIDERRRDLAAGKVSANEDMLSCLISYVDEDGEPLSDADIKDNMLLVLFAGHDTSTVVSTMVCRFLALNPDIFEKVYKENREISIEKGPNEPLSWADIQKMKLSWRVVQETLRLQPPAQGAFRVALQDFEFSGFKIPKAWKSHSSLIRLVSRGWDQPHTHLFPLEGALECAQVMNLRAWRPWYCCTTLLHTSHGLWLTPMKALGWIPCLTPRKAFLYASHPERLNSKRVKYPSLIYGDKRKFQ